MAVILTGVAGVYMNRDDEFFGGSGGDGDGGDSGILLDGGVDVNLSVDGGRQLSITRPFRGGGGGGGGGSGSNDLSLDDGRQLSITHPTSGSGVLSLDGGRQLNPTQPIKSGGGGMSRGPLALVGELRAGDTVSVLSLLTGSPVPTTIRALTEDVQVLTPNLKCLVLMYNYILNLNGK
jgi:CRP-like cAMP-binding protein